MAIYVLSFRPIKRSKGSSAVRHAAYRAGVQLWDERRKKTHDFSQKKDVEHKEIVAPRGAPDWVKDREQLWNHVEAREKLKNSQLAREIYVVVPREILPHVRVDTVRRFVSEEFVKRGMVADFGIHTSKASDGLEHSHAHIMLTTRPLTKDGFGLKDRSWGSPAEVHKIRAAWAKHVNLGLSKSGSLDRADHRSTRVQLKEMEAGLSRALERGDTNRSLYFAEKAARLDGDRPPKVSEKLWSMARGGKKHKAVVDVLEIRKNNKKNYQRRLDRRIREVMKGLDRTKRRQRYERIIGFFRRREPERSPRAPSQPAFKPPQVSPKGPPKLRETLERIKDPRSYYVSRTPEQVHASNMVIRQRLSEILDKAPSPPDQGKGRERSGQREQLERKLKSPVEITRDRTLDDTKERER